jgi:hypothetical protein
MLPIFFLIVLAIVFYFAFKHAQQNHSDEANKDWDYLLVLCGGDQKLAKRLIEYEKRRNPKLDDRKAYRMAIMSYRRDHGWIANE